MSASQNHRMRAILARLELLSHGATQAWNASGGHSGEPDDRIVSQVGRAGDWPHLAYRRAYEEATSDEHRAEVIDAAARELADRTRRSAPAAAASKSLAELIVDDGEGHDPQTVAQHFNVDVAFVRRIRQRGNRDTETGRQREQAQVVDRAQIAARAKELRDRGLTIRQIAMHLKIGVGSVHRILSDRWANLEHYPGGGASKHGSREASDA